jgi:D-alanyl-D-alanine carboxypeptidase/D-alanyl-D-alanine-endopeptidase (penicillin-binding protein 4)
VGIRPGAQAVWWPLCAILMATASASASSRVEKRIDDLKARCPAVQRGQVGYKFIDVATGEVLAAQDSATFFIPASNTKLYTTALALVRLGPNYKFQTELRTTAHWTAGQTALPDLELVGGGDPNLSGRVLPYRPHAPDRDPLAPLKSLADKLVNIGVREINGDVTGVATRYSGDLYPRGWTVDDSLYEYGAPVSALALNDNTLSISLHPSEPGELAEIELRPAINHFLVLNQVITDNSRVSKIHLFRAPGSSEVVLWGAIGKAAREWEEDLAVEDPALFAAEALVDILRDRGVIVRGTARSQYRNLNESAGATQTGTALAVYDSAPLWQEIQVINKVSQNLHAEMLLREVARVTRGEGTLRAGVAEREAFLGALGVTREGTGFDLHDASGLARQNVTTPDSTVLLLRYMWQRPDHDLWVRSLPIAGVDGTLRDRFKHIPGADRIHAKTGEMSHVNALSGYIDSAHHGWLAFSIMVNGTTSSDTEVHAFMDQLCAILLED